MRGASWTDLGPLVRAVLMRRALIIARRARGEKGLTIGYPIDRVRFAAAGNAGRTRHDFVREMLLFFGT